ncbi:MAG: hypothetical protein NTX49_02540 [Chlamydiae bacterium]|nr:hypothetical protein [Chlamydiota bacterium]
MHTSLIEHILKNTSLTQGFYPAVFQAVVAMETGALSLAWKLKEEYDIAQIMGQTGLQDVFKFRCRRRSLLIADGILDEKGDLQPEALSRMIHLLESEGYIPTPQGYSDRSLTNHILEILRKWENNKSFRFILRKFQMPLCHKYAERIIRDTIGVEVEHTLTDRDLRVAVLSACFFPLRQNVGSCFATAPAILIQKEQIENLLADLYDLVTMGKMIRTIAGKEYSVPLSPSIGIGELKKVVTNLSGDPEREMPPGLRIPLEKLQIIPLGISPLEKKLWFSSKLKVFLQEKTSPTIEGFFRFVIFDHLEITEEEMERFLFEELSLFRQSRKSDIIIDPRSSKRNEKFEKARTMEEKAKRIFLCMTENPLARVWEYTLASLSETKMEFSRWNLYSSLGLNQDEPGGIGQIIYKFVEEKIAGCNQKLEEYQQDYEIAFSQLRATETLLKQAASESDARRLKAEYQSRAYHMQSCLEIRDQFYKKSSFYPKLFSFLIKQFDEQFPEYFQEIYDAEMQEVETTEYEDSPAGFRLVYKHGRRDASLWTMIHTQDQFINSLIDFFSFVEPQIMGACETKGCDDDIKEIISLIIIHLRTEDFITSSFQRSAKVHQVKVGKKSLKELQKTEKKPWSYTSGGVMNTLLKTYYRREGEIYEDSFKVEGSLDLLTLILETMKSLPYNFTAYFPKNLEKRVLMHSPTHAFSLLPYNPSFFEAWDDNGFTYTWIRDHFLQPRQNFYRSISLSISEQETLMHLFAGHIPSELSLKIMRAATEPSCSVAKFAKNILKSLPSSPLIEDALDSFLYQALPLIPAHQWKESVTSILQEKVGNDLIPILALFPDDFPGYIPSKLIKELAKAFYLLCKGEVALNFDLHAYVTERAENLKLSSPPPLIFADTNWSQNHFGFVVSPISEEVKLWRVTESGYEGGFLRSWVQYLSPGAVQNWAIYTKPMEYSQVFEKKL